MSLSSDEGEIRDDGNGHLKASHQDSRAGNGVDRQGRPRDPSPANASASRGDARRSRSPRGHKRLRDDGDQYRRGARDYDARSARNRRHDAPRGARRGRDRDSRASDADAPSHDHHRRARISYQDLDGPAARGPTYYNDAAEQHRRRDYDTDRQSYRPHDRAYARDGPWDGPWDRRRRRDSSHYDEPPRRRSRSPDRFRRDANGGAAAASSLPLRPESRAEAPTRPLAVPTLVSPARASPCPRPCPPPLLTHWCAQRARQGAVARARL